MNRCNRSWWCREWKFTKNRRRLSWTLKSNTTWLPSTMSDSVIQARSGISSMSSLHAANLKTSVNMCTLYQQRNGTLMCKLLDRSEVEVWTLKKKKKKKKKKWRTKQSKCNTIVIVAYIKSGSVHFPHYQIAFTYLLPQPQPNPLLYNEQMLLYIKNMFLMSAEQTIDLPEAWPILTEKKKKKKKEPGIQQDINQNTEDIYSYLYILEGVGRPWKWRRWRWRRWWWRWWWW